MSVVFNSLMKKGVKFAIAGGLGVLAGLGTQYLLTTLFHVFYLESAVFGYGVGFIINYLGNIVNGNIKLEDGISTQARQQN